MRIGYFFEGMLCREEAASALLAMALEGVAKFREHFFRLVVPGEESVLGQRSWRVTVEEGQVDVRMQHENTIVLIENKVNRGAKQPGQLRGYYLGERNRHPNARIIAVYLAPGQMGMDEVRQVNEVKNPGDLVQHLSWEKLAAYVPQDSDLIDAIVLDGLSEVKGMIDQNPLYPPDGERGTIRNITNHAIAELRKQTLVSLRRWSGKDFEQILTVGTDVTFWLDAVFKADDQPPFVPINLRDNDGKLQIAIRSQLKLAGKAKATSEIAQWWQSYIRSGIIEIVGVGPHCIDEKEWFMCKREICGDDKQISEALVKTGMAVITALSALLSCEGFELGGANPKMDDSHI